MSQEKVDRYKKEKANRQKNMKKEKIGQMVGRIVGCVVLVVIIGWLGISAFNTIRNRQLETAYVDLDDINSYMSELYAE